MISHLHKDSNTVVEDQRGETDMFIYNSLYYKHRANTLFRNLH